jgi:ABC-type multidrug transport system fused ATPase/permease subunit
MSNVLSIKYKGYEFNVITSSTPPASDTDDTYLETIISIDSTNETIEQFNDEVFFDSFVGFEYEFTEQNEGLLVRRIKKALSEFLKSKKEVTVVKETKDVSEKPLGAIDRVIFEVVERALSSAGTKQEIDTIIKALVKENGIVPFRTVIEVKREDGTKKDVGLQHVEFERILKTLSAGVPAALVGPAGSGKTTIVYKGFRNVLRFPIGISAVNYFRFLWI